MTWEQYSKRRRGMSLEDFLTGCASLQEAVSMFEKRRINPPMALLEKFYASPAPVLNEPDPQQVDTPTDKSKVASSGTSTN